MTTGEPADVPAEDGTAWQGAACGIASAVLFGASAPVAKSLLPAVSPVMLASLLYLGAGMALLVTGRAMRTYRPTEASLACSDVPLLLVVIVAGGILGPVLMLFGLARVSGVNGSLLLNLEAPFTILVAVTLFGEHLGRRELAGAAAIVGGGAILHVHDEHHRHPHALPVADGIAHTHVHTHDPLLHEHPHVPDAHHRHRH